VVGCSAKNLKGVKIVGALRLPEKPEISEGLIKQYFRLRYKVESDFSKIDDSDYERCKVLEKQIERVGVSVESRYQRFKAEKRSMPEEESEALDVAEDIHQEPTKESRRTSFVTAKKDEEIIDKEEIQNIRPDGSAEVITKRTTYVAACGKKISQDEVAGFCGICKEAVCPEHVKYCIGYGGFPCHKLLCVKHTFYFPDEDGTMQPCCLEHYEMKVYFQENPPDFDSKPEKKPKDTEKDKDDE
jgi:hypothetical protein